MKRLLPARLQAALAGERAKPIELPAEVLGESRRRVRFAALLGALAYALFLALELSGATRLSDLEHTIDLRHDVLGLGLCVALAAATWSAFSDRVVLGSALGVEFVLCAVISSHIPWAAFVRTGHVSGLTWVVPIVILFALMVPFSARTTFVASAACLATMPLGLFLLERFDRIAVAASDYWISSFTALVALAIATLAARTVYGAQRGLAAARQIGSYELLEPLGQGGMGEVWKARHLMLARPAALKRILADRLRGSREARETAIERFTREARVTASLRSPHTVELFDFGVSSDGSLYYAMELLDGMNLEHLVYRFGPLEPQRAIHLLRQACHSLAEAHERGLVHRDIKPGNLFLCRYGRDADFLKVLDFGLTRPLADQPDPGITATGLRLGTPDYMAPEQVFGLASDPRTDLYALGCVGYWLLTGVRPFEADSPAESMRRHAQETPPPIGEKSPHPVPPPLEAVILGCLSKASGDRPSSADELERRLAACVGGEPWTVERARGWWDANVGVG